MADPNAVAQPVPAPPAQDVPAAQPVPPTAEQPAQQPTLQEFLQHMHQEVSRLGAELNSTKQLVEANSSKARIDTMGKSVAEMEEVVRQYQSQINFLFVSNILTIVVLVGMFVGLFWMVSKLGAVRAAFVASVKTEIVKDIGEKLASILNSTGAKPQGASDVSGGGVPGVTDVVSSLPPQPVPNQPVPPIAPQPAPQSLMAQQQPVYPQQQIQQVAPARPVFQNQFPVPAA